MLILSIETSGKNGGVALARGDAHSFELLGESAIAQGEYSAQLMPQIVALLASAGITKRELEVIAVASGPGSFTGLRVGIATGKALAEALDKPIVTVSVLEAVAANAQQAGERVAALLDAGRGEAYFGLYGAETVDEMIVKAEELPGRLAGLPQAAAIVTPDEKLAAIFSGATLVQRPGAADIARLGLAKLLRGEAAPVAELDANYIRRSDAELFSLPKIHGR